MAQGTRQNTMRPGKQYSGIREFLIVITLFVVITAAFLWPWLVHISSYLPGPAEDNLLEFWGSWYISAGAEPGHFYATNLIRYPEGVTFYANMSAYPQMFFVLALAKLFGAGHSQLVLYQNLTLLLSFPLAGTATYYLVRHFTPYKPAAWIGGFIFAFNPSHVMHAMHHVSVSTIEFIPVFVLVYFIALERKSIPLLFACILLFALNALTFWYYLFYAAFFVLFHTLYLTVKGNRIPQGWTLLQPAATVLGGTLLLLPLIVPMLTEAAPAIMHFKAGNDYVADIAGFFTFSPTHLARGWVQTLNNRLSGNPWEATVYLGLVNILIFVWAIFRLRRQPGAPIGYAAIGILVFAIMACGSSLHILGFDYSQIHLPYNALTILPFFSNLRSPSRIIVLVYLLLAIAVGYTLAKIAQTPPTGRGKLYFAVLSLLILIDFYPAALETTPVRCPAGLEQLKAEPAQSYAVVNLPLTYTSGETALFEQTCHGHPVVHATQARILKESLVDRLGTHNLDTQKRQLRQNKVKYIILDKHSDWPRGEPAREDYLRTYTLRSDTPDFTILQVY